MSDRSIFKVQHFVKIEEKWHNAVTDLVFRDGAPIAVLAWSGPANDEHPLVLVPLDPSHLVKANLPEVDYIYLRTIEAPQQAQ